MISFVNVGDIGIGGLRIPLSHIEVRDAEFADDTALYLNGDLESEKNWIGHIHIL